MLIYVCSSNIVNNTKREKLTSILSNELEAFYGEIELDYYYKQAEESIYIMGTSAIARGQDQTIKNIITRAYKTVVNDVEALVDVKLNYSLLEPEFKPVNDEMETDTIQGATDQSTDSEEFDYEKLSKNYRAEVPRYSFDQVILPEDILNNIVESIGIIEVEKKVFDDWGLRSIIPEAGSALSFYGPPGTGKTMAAEAIAHRLGKKILRATYADIESKYHGEGPKMVKAIFQAAERDDAVLFLDESDSLLSKRLTNVSDGSSQAINSMRSQLLVSLERFNGIVIFATNLVVNYDQAFLSRLINIEFRQPVAEVRAKIWDNHIKPSETLRIPLGEDVDTTVLGERFEFAGREIKNAVKKACISVALAKRESVVQADFIAACENIRNEINKAVNAQDHAAMRKSESQKVVKEAMQNTLDKSKNNILSKEQLDD